MVVNYNIKNIEYNFPAINDSTKVVNHQDLMSILLCEIVSYFIKLHKLFTAGNPVMSSVAEYETYY